MSDVAKSGWYRDEQNPGLERRWDGQAWTDERRAARGDAAVVARQARHARGPELGGYWICGIVGPILAGALLGASAAVNDDAEGASAALGLGGVIIAYVSMIFLLIAVIATGVSLGIRHRDAMNRIYGD